MVIKKDMAPSGMVRRGERGVSFAWEKEGHGSFCTGLRGKGGGGGGPSYWYKEGHGSSLTGEQEDKGAPSYWYKEGRGSSLTGQQEDKGAPRLLV